MKNHPFSTIFAILTSAAFFGTSVFAGTTDIANAPLASSSSSVVKPNVMFILDDSGSMSFTHLPDDANKFLNQYGYLSSQCNGIFYNPNTIYAPPLDATGVSFPNSSFGAAWVNGFDSTSGTVDLSSKFIANRFDPLVANTNYSSSGSFVLSSLGPYAAFYYTYTGAQTTKNYIDINSTFYKECISSIGSSPGSGVFTKVIVSATSGPSGRNELQNFANWYSYYRTRVLSMKTSASRAFSTLTNSYRVGYMSINNNTTGDLLNLGDFDTTQKANWYTKLFAAVPYNGTPLRSALSTAGLIYAGKLNGTIFNGSTVKDPIQYSCQQNFAILSTDGYWNTGNDSGCSGRGGAGCKLDKTSGVGNTDGAAATPATVPPMLDNLNIGDTLADVAMYYYNTDLRTTGLSNCVGALGAGTDVCVNNVLGTTRDKNAQQHMATYTIGLGVNGTLAYREDYLDAPSGDYFDIKQGTKNWPKPVSDTTTAVDDLWHAAVNGRGIYFNAQNPDALESGLIKALSDISVVDGSGAAAATSNLEPVAADNNVYVATYRTTRWDGDLVSKTIDPSTGAISATADWKAQPLLDAKVSASSDTRTIYTYDGSAASKLKSFQWSTLSIAEQAYFNGMCAPTAKLSQCASLTATQKTAASGQKLVNFIRGQDGNEDKTANLDPDRLYREREHVLGDMINSQPVYVKKPPFVYTDANYNDFRDTAQQNRAAMVYVAVNDGMLHAFDGATGQEKWAYIPQILLPKLYKLADASYASNHEYYVDGSPTIGDICPKAPAATCTGNAWKTILVGGLNAGGRGYYALDVTDPTSPSALWNFTVADDFDLGLTFGNPVISKRQDGTWVVVFSSGYNNVSPGSGRGYLYVLNANTGVVLEKIATSAGAIADPSGLGKINAWVDDTSDNTAQRFYGGDLKGNVWRFDIDNVVPPAGKEALLLAELGQINGAGTQPITTKPELSEIVVGPSKYAVVHIGTGRYLGVSDLTDTSVQSVYSLKDNLTATGLGQVRSTGVLVKQTLAPSASGSTRTATSNAVDWATDSGWYVDLISSGERVNVNMQMQLNLLTVAGNVPSTDVCTPGGYAWLYYFDFKTGKAVPSANGIVGSRLTSNTLVAGITTVKLHNKNATLVTDTRGGTSSNPDPKNDDSSEGKRVSWRELVK